LSQTFKSLPQPIADLPAQLALTSPIIAEDQEIKKSTFKLTLFWN